MFHDLISAEYHGDSSLEIGLFRVISVLPLIVSCCPSSSPPLFRRHGDVFLCISVFLILIV